MCGLKLWHECDGRIEKTIVQCFFWCCILKVSHTKWGEVWKQGTQFGFYFNFLIGMIQNENAWFFFGRGERGEMCVMGNKNISTFCSQKF